MFSWCPFLVGFKEIQANPAILKVRFGQIRANLSPGSSPQPGLGAERHHGGVLLPADQVRRHDGRHGQGAPCIVEEDFGAAPAHYMGVVAPPVPEPVSGWYLHLSVSVLFNPSMVMWKDQSHGRDTRPRSLFEYEISEGAAWQSADPGKHVFFHQDSRLELVEDQEGVWVNRSRWHGQMVRPRSWRPARPWRLS